jgi:hypothetical protein
MENAPSVWRPHEFPKAKEWPLDRHTWTDEAFDIDLATKIPVDVDHRRFGAAVEW